MTDMKRQHLTHPISPTYDKNSRILILGSFPSVKTREMGFFYGHPQNRFWKVMAGIFEESVPLSVEDRRSFLIRNKIAAWDVIASCSIEGSSDSSIKDVKANDLSDILKEAHIEKIITNGKTAYMLYNKYIEPETNFPAICLPSTSPANAAWSLERLTVKWRDAIL